MDLSFIIPCYRSAQTLPSVIEEIDQTMAQMSIYKYEIVMVNDSSPDETFSVIQQLCNSGDNRIGIDLARNFGQHAAIMAGFRQSCGDIVVCLDDDGQTPASEVGKLIEKINSGYDVVYAEYEHKQHSFFRNLGSQLNQLMTERMLGKPKDIFVSSYFAIRRYIVDEIVRYNHSYPYVIGLVLRSTRRICNVQVEHRARNVGSSGYTLRKLIALWMNGFTSFSVLPLRFASLLGGLSALVGFLFAIWIIVNKITNPSVPLGWSSAVAITLFMSGIILIVLGVLGEYVGRVYISINESPQYVIREIVVSDNEN